MTWPLPPVETITDEIRRRGPGVAVGTLCPTQRDRRP